MSGPGAARWLAEIAAWPDREQSELLRELIGTSRLPWRRPTAPARASSSPTMSGPTGIARHLSCGRPR